MGLFPPQILTCVAIKRKKKTQSLNESSLMILKYTIASTKRKIKELWFMGGTPRSI